jgi:Putative Tad-like Flp pilus-assembly
MSQRIKLLFRRSYKDQRGQMIPILAFMMVTFLGMAGIVTDVGHAYFAYRLLLNSTNAAALAGAQGLPYNTTSTNQALLNAQAYSSQSGDKNAYGNLTVTSATYTLGCVTATIGAGIPCIDTGVGSGTANAIQVTQKASVPTTFMRLFGFSTISLSATGTALIKGSANTAYNVAIIVDTTQSMSSNTDSNCNNVSRLQCALSGVQVFLQDLSPCAASGCGALTSGNYKNSLDRVALFSFPNFTTTTAGNQYDCGSSLPTPEVYTFPAIGATSMTPMTYTTGSGKSATTVNVTYQDTYGIGDTNGFVSDYRTSNGATSLNSSGSNQSDIVLAAGGKSGCTGMTGPSGEGTYYAGVIYAAQAALTAEANANPGSQNVMILVSDGTATSDSSQMATGTQSTTVATANPSNQYKYPSYNNECQQAALAGQYATSQGTTVYAVAYGAPSTGCTTDTGNYASPCYTMSKIASSAATFYSDDNQSGTSSNCPAGKSVQYLNAIFNQIAGNLTTARLIPNSTFP